VTIKIEPYYALAVIMDEHKINEVIKVLLKYEGDLSDGYCYYCQYKYDDKGNRVSRTLDELLREIAVSILNIENKTAE